MSDFHSCSFSKNIYICIYISHESELSLLDFYISAGTVSQMKPAFSGGIIPHYLGKLIGSANPTEASTSSADTRYLSCPQQPHFLVLKREKETGLCT